MLFQLLALIFASAFLCLGTIPFVESANEQLSSGVVREKVQKFLNLAKDMRNSVNQLKSVYDGKLDNATKKYLKAIEKAISEFSTVLNNINGNKMGSTKANARATSAHKALVKASKLYFSKGNSKMLDEIKKGIADKKLAGKDSRGDDPEAMLNSLYVKRDALLKKLMEP